EAGKRYGTTESQLKILRGQLNDVAITFGGPLVAALNSAISAAKPMIETLAKVAEAFANADPKTQGFILKMAALAASAGPVLKVFGKMSSVFGKTISTMFEKAGNIDSKWQQFITKPITRGSSSALQAV